MKILYVRASNSRGYTVIGLISDTGQKESYTVSDSYFISLGLGEGALLNERTLLNVKGEDEVYRAKKKALSILSYADNSRLSLYNKLLRAGFSKDVAESTVDEMCSLGYINESERLRRLIFDEVNLKLTGKQKLIPKLISKGYKFSDIERAIEELTSSGDIDFKASAKKLVKKNLGENPSSEDVKKLLYKNGYYVCSDDL
jgi:SOS response regulatory protein OraA/RecX